MKIQLVDYNEELCSEWKKEFKGCKDVDVVCGNFFKVPADCWVSPANSFAFLDGGIDEHIRKHYEKNNFDIQRKAWDTVVEKFNGEILVGQAAYVPVYVPDRIAYKQEEVLPDLIIAPTMRVPMKLPHDTVNVYLAMRAIILKLKELKNSGFKKSEPYFETELPFRVSISGLGTGIGQLPYNVCARQMKLAYNDFWVGKNYFPETWSEAQDRHQIISTNEIKGDLQY